LLTVRVVPADAQSGVRIAVVHRDAADRFELLDNVSSWWPEYVEPEYRAAWIARGLARDGDSAFFARYAAIRGRYLPRPQSNASSWRERSGLFSAGDGLTGDTIAAVFHRATSMEGAFTALRSLVTTAELAQLRAFYAHFEERVSPLVAETRALTQRSRAASASTLDRPEVIRYLGDVARLLTASLDSTRAVEAIYVWWPDTLQRRASPVGTSLIVRVRPSADDVVNSADVIAHEAVHLFAASMPIALQQQLSATFLDGCTPPPGVRRLAVLEEPLATALGNITFRQRFQPERFSWGRRWYGDAWVDVFARLLQPMLVERWPRVPALDVSFAREASALCASLGRVAQPR
jgi:hypothetical protein